MQHEQKTVRRALVWLPVLIWAGLIYLGSDQPQVTFPDLGILNELGSVAGHFVEYAVLMALLARAFRGGTRMPAKYVWPVAYALVALYGLSDEYHQSFVPGRDPNVLDWVTDMAGAGFAWWVVWRRGRVGASPQ